MARIPEQEIERLKREVSVVRLVEGRGVELKPHGRDLIGRCPFHEDHEPSLIVSPKRNLWHCLGACQAGGSVIDWVMRAEAVSFRHAVEILRRDVLALPSSTETRPSAVKRSTVPRLPSVLEAGTEAQQALQHVIEYYHATLKESPEALGYLENRGLLSSEMVDHFKLGFANRTLGYHLPQKNRQAGALIRGQLTELGILRGSGHEHFAGSLVIPVFDEEGQIAEVYGRKVTPRLRSGTPDHLYLPGPHRGVFNAAALGLSEEVILCEALIDALTFWCAGYRHVTSSYGVEGFTADHQEAFRRHGVRRVLIAYDRDEAGDRAAEKLAAQLISEGLECFRVVFPKGMDANEYALSVRPAERSLELVLKQALWLGRGKTVPVRAEGEGAGVEGESERLGGAAKRESKGETDAALAAEASTVEASEEVEGKPSVEDGPSISPLVADEEHSPSTESSPPASAPEAVAADVQVQGDEVVLHFGDRRWRVRGFGKGAAVDQLRVNVLVSRERQSSEGSGYFVDTLDLYSARHRAAYVKQAAEELAVSEDVIKRELGQVLLSLEALCEQRRKEALAPRSKTPELTDEERAAALELLRDPHLLDRILVDFERCGVVGERTNKLVGYLAAVSRKLEEPLAVVIQSSSAAGKTSLMEAVLAFVPEEERVKYSAMTGQSLFYMGQTDLAHKVLAVVEEEGAERASYALKLLQSERELSIASTGKDPQTGKLVTHEYRVEGPVAIFLTTTAAQVDEELLNRCMVLGVDEERAQTRAIHERQRERQTLQGLLARRQAEAVRKLHQDAQRLLKPVLVANPFAQALTFLDDRTRTRRDHMKYLTLIRAVALLHQYQRPTRSIVHEGKVVPYIEVTAEDIAVANGLAHEVLGRSLDELAPQTRRLLMLLEEMVRAGCEQQRMLRSEYRFTRRQVRERTGWGSTQLKLHMHRLEELEYVVIHRGGHGQQLVYELVYGGEGKDDAPFLPGLIDARTLDGCDYDAHRSGINGHWSGVIEEKSGGGRGQVGAKSGGCRGGDNGQSVSDSALLPATTLKPPKNAYGGNGRKSYVLVRHSDKDNVIAPTVDVPDEIN